MTTTNTTTSNTSATSSIISALGAGSGVDMVALANNLAAAQFAGRVDRLSAKTEKLEAQISEISTLRSMMLSLATSLGDRIRQGDLSAQPSIDSASVAMAKLSGSQQPKGSYSLEVEQLAKQQILTSNAYGAETDVVGAGTITLRFGEVAGGAFSEDGAKAPVNITIPPGATLKETAAAINASGAGIQAYVAQTADGAQLVLKGKEGANSGFIVEVAEDGANPGLSALAWQPGSANGSLLQTATDAKLKIDGLAVTSPSNTVTEAIPGVSLTLTGTNVGAPTTVRFADPSAAISSSMQDLTSALNEIAGQINAVTDPMSGPLARDYSARTLRQTFAGLASRVIMPGAPEGGIRTLGDLGVMITREGTFEFDAGRLAASLKRDPEGVSAMFTTGVSGLYATMDGISRKASLSSDPGTLAGAMSSYSKQLMDVKEDQVELAEDQETMRQRLVARFATSDSRVAGYQSTLSFLQTQIDAWNAKD